MRYNHFDMLPERAFMKVGGRITLEGGGGSGGGTQQTNATTYQTNIPEWLRAPTERTVARGETLSEQAYTPYTGPRTAGFSPAQQSAFNQIYGMKTPGEFGASAQSVGAAQQYGAAGANQAMGFRPTDFNEYQMAGPQNVAANTVRGTGYNAAGAANIDDVVGTGYNAAQAQAAMAKAAPDVKAQALKYYQMQTPEEFTGATAKEYMSPYQQNVTDITKREATTEAQQLARQQAGQAAKAGAFGGSRFGVEQALLGKSLATNLADIQTKGQQAAYENAQQQFERDRAANMMAGRENLQANLGVQSLGAGQNLQAALANQQIRQQTGLSNQSAAMQAAMANQAAANQARQFGAQQGMTAQQLNQQYASQQALANQAARNQASQFAATQGMTAQQLNQQAGLQAALANQQMQYNVGQQNLSALLSVQQQQEAARQAAARMNLEGAQFGAQTGLQSGQQLASLGSARQAADLQRINALSTVGAQQQALQQQQYDQAYRDFLEQRDWEKNQLGWMSGLLRGTPFSTSGSQQYTGAAPNQMSQYLGMGITGLGLAGMLGGK